MQFKNLLVSLFLASAVVAAPLGSTSTKSLDPFSTINEYTEKITNSGNNNKAGAGNGNGNDNGQATGNGNGNGNGNGANGNKADGNGSGNDASADNNGGNGSNNSAGNGNSAGDGSGSGNEVEGSGNGNGSGNGSPTDFLKNFGNTNVGDIGGKGETNCNDNVEQNGMVNVNASPCISL